MAGDPHGRDDAAGPKTDDLVETAQSGPDAAVHKSSTIVNRLPDAAARALSSPLPSMLGKQPAPSGNRSRVKPEGTSKSSEVRFRHHQVLAGKYRLEKSIARGGMGWVFLATQIPLGRQVAIKVMSPMVNDPIFRRRFLLEASTCAKLSHRHIVTIHDYGETSDGDLFMAMEYLQGQSLSQLLAKNKRVPVIKACDIGMQIAQALRAAHKIGVIHRDLKPSNIMLLDSEEDGSDGNYFVKVVDFGLVKLLQPEGVHSIELTRPGTLLGSPRYIAPEQIRNEEVDERTDVYSLGVILFCMVTGTPPFDSTNTTDLLAQHLRDDPPKMGEVARDLQVPDELERIVKRAMSKNREKRHRNIDGILSELKDVYANLTGRVADSNSTSPEDSRPSLAAGAMPAPSNAIPAPSSAIPAAPAGNAPSELADTVLLGSNRRTSPAPPAPVVRTSHGPMTSTPPRAAPKSSTSRPSLSHSYTPLPKADDSKRGQLVVVIFVLMVLVAGSLYQKMQGSSEKPPSKQEKTEKPGKK